MSTPAEIERVLDGNPLPTPPVPVVTPAGVAPPQSGGGTSGSYAIPNEIPPGDLRTELELATKIVPELVRLLIPPLLGIMAVLEKEIILLTLMGSMIS